MTVLVWTAWAMRRDWRSYLPVIVGLALLLVFVVVRASPVQHVTSVLGFDVSGLRGKRHILELLGILLVGGSAGVKLLVRSNAWRLTPYSRNLR